MASTYDTRGKYHISVFNLFALETSKVWHIVIAYEETVHQTRNWYDCQLPNYEQQPWLIR